MGELREQKEVELYLNEPSYRNSIHDSIGPSIANTLNGNLDDLDSEILEEHRDVFGHIEPDTVLSEAAYNEGGLAVEDWILIDEDREEAILIQGKSYPVETHSQTQQVDGYLSYLRPKKSELYRMLEGNYIVQVNASGISDPGKDFAKLEEGVRQAVRNGDTVKFYADVYEVEDTTSDTIEGIENALSDVYPSTNLADD